MITHPELVKKLAKDGATILREMDAQDMHLLHMSLGICGESGELLDAIKGGAIYRKEYNRANIIEELGDLEFYMEGLRQGFRITREETLAANIVKLSKRYHDLQFSNKRAAERADKAEEAEYKDKADPMCAKATSDYKVGKRRSEQSVVTPAQIQKQINEAEVERGVRIVHHLHAGVTDCGIFGVTVPKDWPAGHIWSAHWAEVDCSACLAAKK